jgi:predicted nicotinamide N-methyase
VPSPLPDAETFIRAHLPLAEVPGTGLRLHLAGPRSGLARVVPPGGTPYWAHAWPGGLALAFHLAAHPETVRGRAVWELGSGSALVAIAALKAGAGGAVAIDADPLAAVAARLNAEANGVHLRAVTRAASSTVLDEALMRDISGAPVVLAGDVFYAKATARRAAAALDAAREALGPSTPVLVGDIGRRFLPLDRLEPLAAYPVRDVGDPRAAAPREGWVHPWR